jgi:hypothetical protein
MQQSAKVVFKLDTKRGQLGNVCPFPADAHEKLQKAEGDFGTHLDAIGVHSVEICDLLVSVFSSTLV